MSDSEDDYMSDKLLSGCMNTDIRPGLLFNASEKRKHELYKKQQVAKSKKPKTYHEQEAEIRDKGLGTAIASDNKGFQLLKKMGYKAGSGLGKTIDGITEPVTIKVKKDTAGVGREEHVQNILQTKSNAKQQTLKASETKFLMSRAERSQIIVLQKDFKKAQRICEELDLKRNKQAPDVPYFWSRQTRDALNNKKGDDQDDEETEEEEEEEEEEITEPKLCDIILYIRKKYSYCLYCGDYIHEQQSCPGYFRKEHDE